MKILEFFFKQIITIYIGCSLVYLYYKISGKEISYSDILNKTDEKTGMKKYRYIGFYTGVIFLILLVLLLKASIG